MARTVLPLAGAFVGSFFGAPQLGFAIGSVIGNAVDPQRIKGPRIGDANVQTSQEGAPRPIVYGTAAVMGNLIDRGPLNKVITEERQGKGGGPVVENESLFMTFAIRICEGPIDGVSRIWEDERLVYDIRPESEIQQDSTRYAEGFTLYLGDEDQLPAPDLETIHGVGNTPAHRGSAYIVFKEKNLTERRGSIPQFRFEVNGCLGQPEIVGSWVAFGRINESGDLGTFVIPSIDGADWDASTIPLDLAGQTVIVSSGFSDGTLLAHNGTNNPIVGLNIFRSTSFGASFSLVPFPTQPREAHRRIEKRDGRWFIPGQSSGGGSVYSDDDGLTWQSATGTSVRIGQLTGSAGVLQSFGGSGSAILQTSDNGSSWAFGSFTEAPFTPSASLYEGGNAIAIGATAGTRNRYTYATIGVYSWAPEQSLPVAGPIAENVAASGNGVCVAASEAGEVIYSTDSGQNWLISSYTLPGTPQSIAFGGGRFVLVGLGGSIAYSDDGINWTEVFSPTVGSSGLTSVCYLG